MEPKAKGLRRKEAAKYARMIRQLNTKLDEIKAVFPGATEVIESAQDQLLDSTNEYFLLLNTYRAFANDIRFYRKAYYGRR